MRLSRDYSRVSVRVTTLLTVLLCLSISEPVSAQPTVAQGNILFVNDSVTVPVDGVPTTFPIDTEALPVGPGDSWSVAVDPGAAGRLLFEFDYSEIPGLTGFVSSYEVDGTATVMLGNTTYAAQVLSVAVVNDFHNEQSVQDPVDVWTVSLQIADDFGGCVDDTLGNTARVAVSFIDLTATTFDNTDYTSGIDVRWPIASSLSGLVRPVDPMTGLCLPVVGTAFVGPAGSIGTYFDVLSDHWAGYFIRTLAASGITSGCGQNNYCPDAFVTRAQMAVFLERGMHGSDFAPLAATGHLFLDVGASDFAASFIEQLFNDGITSGCGGNNYCPADIVTRAQMAVFLLRAKHGAAYIPPPATGEYTDAGPGHWAAAWIEQLAAEGITSGCGEGIYCPEEPVTRAQMAVFLVRAFGLGPSEIPTPPPPPPPPPTDPFVGTWSITSVATSPDPTCSGTDVYTAEITKQGDLYSITALGTTVQEMAAFDGSVLIVEMDVAIPEDGGTTTAHINGQFFPDGTYEGVAGWVWTNGEDSCSGTATLTGVKIN